MKCASVPSAYRNCILRASVLTGRNFSPARNVRSITAPSAARRSFVRTNAPPLPGLTCWNSRILKIVPSTSMWLPFLNWFVEIRSISPFCRQKVMWWPKVRVGSVLRDDAHRSPDISCGDTPRKRAQVVVGESADLASIVGVGEQLADWLVHAVDHGDLRLHEAALREFLERPVLQAAEQSVLASAWSGDADLVVAAHRSMHRFPLAAAAEGGRRRSTHRLEDGEHRHLHLLGAAVEELVGRNSAVSGSVIDDAPGHRPNVRPCQDAPSSYATRVWRRAADRLRGTMRTSASSASAIATTVRNSGFTGAVSNRRMLASFLPISRASAAFERLRSVRNSSSVLISASITAISRCCRSNSARSSGLSRRRRWSRRS